MDERLNRAKLKCEEFINELKAAGFDDVLNGTDSISPWDWLDAQKQANEVSSDLQLTSGCTRLVFWYDEDLDFVFKMQIRPDYYVADGGKEPIDYNENEYFMYQKAVEAGLDKYFAWIAPVGIYVIDDGDEAGATYDIYAMEYCECDEDHLSAESEDLMVRSYCEAEGLEWDDLDDEQQDKIRDCCDDATDSEGMLNYAGEVWGWRERNKVEELLDEHDVSDIHSGNWGLRPRTGELVLVDYAGYRTRVA